MKNEERGELSGKQTAFDWATGMRTGKTNRREFHPYTLKCNWNGNTYLPTGVTINRNK